MKTAVIFKHFLSTFAALSLVCIASSCRDQDFDWDNAHALTAEEKFTDTFIKEFGKPADGHMWGFDKNWVPSFTRSMTRGYIAKVESEYIPHLLTYGTVPNIEEKEHQEVFEWFSTHQVTWSNTTSIVGYHKDGDRVQVQTECYIVKEEIYKEYIYDYQPGDIIPDWQYNNFSEEEKSKVERGTAWVDVTGSADAYKSARVVKSDGTIIYGDFLYDGDGGRNPDTRIVKLVSGLGTKNADGSEATAVATGELSAGNSIRTYSPDKVGTCNVGLVINFKNAWVQNVASESDILLPSPTEEKSATSDAIVTTKGKLNYLQFFDMDGNALHTNDFNAEGGYGYPKTGGYTKLNHPVKDDNTGKQYYFDFNGDLIFDADFSNTAVFNTLDSKLHDKWIIVYLKGEGYEGWYLGFDQEGAGNNENTIVGANGYCNNWIIKLTALNEAKSVEPVRIMCEDLGGLTGANVSLTDKRVLISDIDYNDIVLDVTPSQNKRSVTLKLQAAGGTLPLTVWYGETCLFETHELFNGRTAFANTRHLPAPDYGVMYNTGESSGTAPTIELHLDGKNNNGQGSDSSHKIHVEAEDFNINKLYFKVCRFDVQKYLDSSRNDYSEAIWVNINNITGQAPLKLCVPQTVKWLKERHKINDGYPSFVDWVKDPTGFFWTKTIITEHLY